MYKISIKYQSFILKFTVYIVLSIFGLKLCFNLLNRCICYFIRLIRIQFMIFRKNRINIGVRFRNINSSMRISVIMNILNHLSRLKSSRLISICCWENWTSIRCLFRFKSCCFIENSFCFVFIIIRVYFLFHSCEFLLFCNMLFIMIICAINVETCCTKLGSHIILKHKTVLVFVIISKIIAIAIIKIHF